MNVGMNNTEPTESRCLNDGGFFNAISLSGGKDSTAMLLLMIERGMPIDIVISADTGMDYVQSLFM